MILIDISISIAAIIGVILTVFFIGFVLVMTAETIWGFIEVIVGRVLLYHFVIFPKSLNPHDEKTLIQLFPFYKKLKGRKKRVFDTRVRRFLKDKLFNIATEIRDPHLAKLLISASAVRLTFGFHNYLFPSFHTIVVHPTEYYSKFTKQMTRGETNGVGFIAFSWDAFLFGIKHDNDSLNLGYHEFAHALFIEHLKMTMEPVLSQSFERWNQFVVENKKMQEVHDHKFFREYATHNSNEFFAVAVENFFERPEQFQKDLPGLYSLMKKLLNQNPEDF